MSEMFTKVELMALRWCVERCMLEQRGDERYKNMKTTDNLEKLYEKVLNEEFDGSPPEYVRAEVPNAPSA